VRTIDGDALQEKLTKKKPAPANARYTEGFNDALLRFKSMIHTAPIIEPELKWIPVCERLPEEETDVLICNSTGNIEISRGLYSTEASDWIWYTSGWRFGKVIAWMPLPEPYREDGGK
jgi:hypothetical protein